MDLDIGEELTNLYLNINALGNNMRQLRSEIIENIRSSIQLSNEQLVRMLDDALVNQGLINSRNFNDIAQNFNELAREISNKVSITDFEALSNSNNEMQQTVTMFAQVIGELAGKLQNPEYFILTNMPERNQVEAVWQSKEWALEKQVNNFLLSEISKVNNVEATTPFSDTIVEEIKDPKIVSLGEMQEYLREYEKTERYKVSYINLKEHLKTFAVNEVKLINHYEIYRTLVTGVNNERARIDKETFAYIKEIDKLKETINLGDAIFNKLLIQYSNYENSAKHLNAYHNIYKIGNPEIMDTEMEEENLKANWRKKALDQAYNELLDRADSEMSFADSFNEITNMRLKILEDMEDKDVLVKKRKIARDLLNQVPSDPSYKSIQEEMEKQIMQRLGMKDLYEATQSDFNRYISEQYMNLTDYYKKLMEVKQVVIDEEMLRIKTIRENMLNNTIIGARTENEYRPYSLDLKFSFKTDFDRPSPVRKAKTAEEIKEELMKKKEEDHVYSSSLHYKQRQISATLEAKFKELDDHIKDSQEIDKPKYQARLKSLNADINQLQMELKLTGKEIEKNDRRFENELLKITLAEKIQYELEFKRLKAQSEIKQLEMYIEQFHNRVTGSIIPLLTKKQLKLVATSMNKQLVEFLNEAGIVEAGNKFLELIDAKNRVRNMTKEEFKNYVTQGINGALSIDFNICNTLEFLNGLKLYTEKAMNVNLQLINLGILDKKDRSKLSQSIYNAIKLKRDKLINDHINYMTKSKGSKVNTSTLLLAYFKVYLVDNYSLITSQSENLNAIKAIVTDKEKDVLSGLTEMLPDPDNIYEQFIKKPLHDNEVHINWGENEVSIISNFLKTVIHNPSNETTNAVLQEYYSLKERTPVDIQNVTKVKISTAWDDDTYNFNSDQGLSQLGEMAREEAISLFFRHVRFEPYDTEELSKIKLSWNPDTTRSILMKVEITDEEIELVVKKVKDNRHLSPGLHPFYRYERNGFRIKYEVVSINDIITNNERFDSKVTSTLNIFRDTIIANLGIYQFLLKHRNHYINIESVNVYILEIKNINRFAPMVLFDNRNIQAILYKYFRFEDSAPSILIRKSEYFIAESKEDMGEINHILDIFLQYGEGRNVFTHTLMQASEKNAVYRPPTVYLVDEFRKAFPKADLSDYEHMQKKDLLILVDSATKLIDGIYTPETIEMVSKYYPGNASAMFSKVEGTNHYKFLIENDMISRYEKLLDLDHEIEVRPYDIVLYCIKMGLVTYRGRKIVDKHDGAELDFNIESEPVPYESDIPIYYNQNIRYDILKARLTDMKFSLEVTDLNKTINLTADAIRLYLKVNPRLPLEDINGRFNIISIPGKGMEATSEYVHYKVYEADLERLKDIYIYGNNCLLLPVTAWNGNISTIEASFYSEALRNIIKISTLASDEEVLLSTLQNFTHNEQDSISMEYVNLYIKNNASLHLGSFPENLWRYNYQQLQYILEMSKRSPIDFTLSYVNVPMLTTIANKTETLRKEAKMAFDLMHAFKIEDYTAGIIYFINKVLRGPPKNNLFRSFRKELSEPDMAFWFNGLDQYPSVVYDTVAQATKLYIGTLSFYTSGAFDKGSSRVLRVNGDLYLISLYAEIPETTDFYVTGIDLDLIKFINPLSKDERFIQRNLIKKYFISYGLYIKREDEEMIHESISAQQIKDPLSIFGEDIEEEEKENIIQLLGSFNFTALHTILKTPADNIKKLLNKDTFIEYLLDDNIYRRDTSNEKITMALLSNPTMIFDKEFKSNLIDEIKFWKEKNTSYLIKLIQYWNDKDYFSTSISDAILFKSMKLYLEKKININSHINEVIAKPDAVTFRVREDDGMVVSKFIHANRNAYIEKINKALADDDVYDVDITDLLPEMEYKENIDLQIQKFELENLTKQELLKSLKGSYLKVNKDELIKKFKDQTSYLLAKCVLAMANLRSSTPIYQENEGDSKRKIMSELAELARFKRLGRNIQAEHVDMDIRNPIEGFEAIIDNSEYLPNKDEELLENIVPASSAIDDQGQSVIPEEVFIRQPGETDEDFERRKMKLDLPGTLISKLNDLREDFVKKLNIFTNDSNIDRSISAFLVNSRSGIHNDLKDWEELESTLLIYRGICDGIIELAKNEGDTFTMYKFNSSLMDDFTTNRFSSTTQYHLQFNSYNYTDNILERFREYLRKLKTNIGYVKQYDTLHGLTESIIRDTLLFIELIGIAFPYEVSMLHKLSMIRKQLIVNNSIDEYQDPSEIIVKPTTCAIAMLINDLVEYTLQDHVRQNTYATRESHPKLKNPNSITNVRSKMEKACEHIEKNNILNLERYEEMKRELFEDERFAMLDHQGDLYEVRRFIKNLKFCIEYKRSQIFSENFNRNRIEILTNRQQIFELDINIDTGDIIKKAELLVNIEALDNNMRPFNLRVKMHVNGVTTHKANDLGDELEFPRILHYYDGHDINNPSMPVSKLQSVTNGRYRMYINSSYNPLTNTLSAESILTSMLIPSYFKNAKVIASTGFKSSNDNIIVQFLVFKNSDDELYMIQSDDILVFTRHKEHGMIIFRNREEVRNVHGPNVKIEYLDKRNSEVISAGHVTQNNQKYPIINLELDSTNVKSQKLQEKLGIFGISPSVPLGLFNVSAKFFRGNYLVLRDKIFKQIVNKYSPRINYTPKDTREVVNQIWDTLMQVNDSADKNFPIYPILNLYNINLANSDPKGAATLINVAKSQNSYLKDIISSKIWFPFNTLYTEHIREFLFEFIEERIKPYLIIVINRTGKKLT